MRNARLIAMRDLVGDYGRVSPGQQFLTDEKTAEALEARGLVRRDFSKPPPKKEEKSWIKKIFT